MRQSRRLVLLAFLITTLLGGGPASADDRKGDRSNDVIMNPVHAN